MYSNGKTFLSLIVGILYAMGINAHAQTIRQDTLAQVVVTERTATMPLSLSSTTTAHVQSLSGKAMTQLGISGVSEALKQMSGLEVKDYGGMGGMKSISIRHLGAQHTAVLYDGVPVSNCQAGQIDISRFATDEHSAVTVTIGAPQNLLAPASVEPYSGHIHIQNNNARNSASVTFSNWNTWDGKVTCNSGQLQAKVNYRHTDGNYPFTLTNGNEHTREVRNNGRYDALTSQLSHNKEWEGGSYLRSHVYYHYSNQGLPGSIVLYNMVSHQQMRDHNLLLQSRGEWRLSDRFTLATIAKYNLATTWYDDGNLAANNSPDAYGKAYNYRQHEGYLSAALQYQISGFAVALIQDLSLNTLWSDINENPNPQRLSSNTALRSRASVPLWYTESETLDVLASCVVTKTAEFCADVQGHCYVLPSIGLSMPVGGGFRLRASWRKALRMPSFNDLYYYQLGNHNLRPELSSQWDLGLTYRTKRSIEDMYRLEASADVYHYDVTDKIVAFPTTFAWKMVNLGHEKICGLNISLTAAYKFRQDLQLSVSGSYNYQDVNLPYSPRHTASVGTIVHTAWVDVGYRLQVLGERYSKLDSDWRYRLDAFADHSLTFSKSFQLGSNNAYQTRNIRINLSIINLTDQQYEIIQYYPMPGRHCSLGVSINL